MITKTVDSIDWKNWNGVEISELDRDMWAVEAVNNILSGQTKYSTCLSGNRLVVAVQYHNLIDVYDCIVTRLERITLPEESK